MSLLDSQSFIVVDIETTGMTPPEHAITEIAALRIWRGQVTDRFATLVNPGRPIPYPIQQFTGITNAMVANAPRIDEVIAEFWYFAGPAPIVAHNSAFDRRFINHFARQAMGLELTNDDLCTVRLARKLLPQLSSKSLGPVAAHFGIDIQARHRAMGDAEATAEVFLHFLRRLDADGIRDLPTLLDYQLSAAARKRSAR